MRQKRFLALLLVIFCLMPVFALSDSVQATLSKLSDNELLQLKAALDDELESRGLSSSGAAVITSAVTADEPLVWIPKSGSKYHSKSTCSNMKGPSEVTLDVAKSLGYDACKKCRPPR